MLNGIARSAVSRVTDPIGRGLLKSGLNPDTVTILGTAGVVIGAIALFGTDHLFIGTMVVTLFVLFDLFDGAMARARGYGTDFGVVLDASCDRIADGAVFGSLAFWAFIYLDQPSVGVAALLSLITGQVVSYIKARADSVNLPISGALAERAERNVLGLVGSGLQGLGVPHALEVCLWVLAAASVFTVVQRLIQVKAAYGQREQAAHEGAASSPKPSSGAHPGSDIAPGPGLGTGPDNGPVSDIGPVSGLAPGPGGQSSPGVFPSPGLHP